MGLQRVGHDSAAKWQWISTLLSFPTILYLRTFVLGSPTWDTDALVNLSRQGWSLFFFVFDFSFYFFLLPPNRLSLSSSLFLKIFQLANCQFSWWLSISQECILMRRFWKMIATEHTKRDCLDNSKEWTKMIRKEVEIGILMQTTSWHQLLHH